MIRTIMATLEEMLREIIIDSVEIDKTDMLIRNTTKSATTTINGLYAFGCIDLGSRIDAITTINSLECDALNDLHSGTAEEREETEMEILII